MPDKNIVDDYYAQASAPEQKAEIQGDKPKVQIKGKLKIKSKPEEQKAPQKAQASDSSAPKVQKVKKWPSKIQQPSLSAGVSLLWENAPTGKIQNGAYFTKKWLEEKDKPTGWFPKKDFSKPRFQKPAPSTSDKPASDAKKEPFHTSYTTSAGALENKSRETDAGGGFQKREFFGAPKTQFVAKPGKKKTKAEEESEKRAKFFKKDKNSKYSKNFFEDEDTSFSRSTKIKKNEKVEKVVEDMKQDLVNRTGETVTIGEVLSVKEFSEKLWVPIVKLMAEFMKNGMRVTLNSKIDYETAAIIAETFEIKLQRDISSWLQVEDVLEWNIQALIAEDNPENYSPRSPVISIMGHVDHGKTSLLDHIRKSKIADKEAGWITQSIGAYQVQYNNQKITFLDTPWHEAFTIMRARGAKSTDIAILVVAADEWVKPQTIESINHAKEAGIPVVVAINKMDKEGANPDFVKGQLAGYGLQPEDWGGDTPMIPVSAHTGFGIDDLLEVILIVAEMQELKANPNRPAIGTIIESHLDMSLGPVSTILINTWTLNKWDYVVCKGSYGRVKVLKDYLSKNIAQAGPSSPVLVVGLDSVADGWDIIQVVSDAEKARQKAMEYHDIMMNKKALSSSSIDLIMSKIKSGSLKQLKVVVKADTNGSLEAIKGAIVKLSTPETKVSVIHSWVWNITEWDALMCQWSSAVLIGYNVDLLGNTKNIVDDQKIEYISSKIIYHITERIEKIVTWMLDPKEVEVPYGEAKVAGIFYSDKWFMILGLKIPADTKIEKGLSVRIIRKDKLLGKWLVENLKSWIIDVNELEGPIECWIKCKTDVIVEMGDILEMFKIEIQK